MKSVGHTKSNILYSRPWTNDPFICAHQGEQNGYSNHPKLLDLEINKGGMFMVGLADGIGWEYEHKYKWGVQFNQG